MKSNINLLYYLLKCNNIFWKSFHLKVQILEIAILGLHTFTQKYHYHLTTILLIVFRDCKQHISLPVHAYLFADDFL